MDANGAAEAIVQAQRENLACGSASKRESPKVTVIVPCLNEAVHIRSCLESLLNGGHPHDRLEVLVVDGLSTDGTRDILAEYVDKYECLRIIDNPGASKPRAMNLGIVGSSGDLIIIAGAHADYSPNYIARLVETSLRTGADNVGGILVAAEGNSVMSRAIAIAVCHPFAAGNARHRTGTTSISEVETVYGGCYPRAVFERVGLFNESLTRTQDREFNYRLRQAGGKIVVNPEIRCSYVPRQTLSDYARWCYAGGRWLFLGRRMTQASVISWRNVVPPAFVAYHALPAVLGAAGSAWAVAAAAAPIALYWLAALGVSAVEAIRRRNSAPLMIALLGVFAATHYAYGLGGLVGMVQAFGRREREIRS